ncbi:FecR family protein [Sphingopyxis sp.]|uniref:FecR family protein n=1 Tax=Sphingopyxis sp. TaxID=1908224 RepID=UPI003BA9ADBE
MLALSLGFAWIFLGQRGGEPVVAENATGEVVLEDGTRVALMDGAKFERRFGPNERRVILTGGRARFTVAHDASRPFRVEADGSLTTALGTVFEVDLTGAAPIIHLVEGSVEIGATQGPAAALRLRPGQRATVADNRPQLLRSPSREQETVMTSPVPVPVPDKSPESLLIADKLPLGAVIDRANRVNAVQIELADTALAAKPISGTFDVADARSLSRKLGVAFDLDVQESGGRFILRPK